ncbi:MAG: ribose 5-phosphate isomerase B [Planctomycetota bacterium]|jgi:ribose 5-phosphate isomerase B
MSDESRGERPGSAIVGSDHAGIEGRRTAASILRDHGFEVTEVGPSEGESADYPDLAHEVASRVESGAARFGVLVCGTGQGMAMAANRHSGVRAAVIADAFTAEMSRAHNDANIACFGERVIGIQGIEALLEVFLRTDFEGGRHERRVGKIETGVAER